MAVPSLDDLLAELDRQDEMEAVPEIPEKDLEEPKVHPEEGGSTASGRRRKGGRFSDLLGGRQPPSLLEDGDTSTREGERSPHTSLAGYRTPQQHRESSSSEEAETSREAQLERQKAQAEAAAFEERQQRAREEAEAQARQEQQRLLEAAREAWERQRMGAEEREERERRANRYAGLLEEKTRKLVAKESSKRKIILEEEKKHKERQKQEKMRSEAAKMSEQIRKMAENGYALGPGGWVRLEWLPGQEVQPSFQAPAVVEEEAEGDASDDPYEVIDQRPQASEPMLEQIALEEVLADLDKKQMEGMASGLSADLETVLDIVAADEQRDLAAATALSVRQGYEQLGAVAVGAEELATATETAAKVLQAAKSRRPDAKFGEAINAESALKPFNDFVEEKQEGSNSYEERQARSAAIQAKLQAARNRLSIVRYDRNAPEKPAVSTRQEAKSKPKPKPKPPRRDVAYGTYERRSGKDAGWGWLQPGR